MSLINQEDDTMLINRLDEMMFAYINENYSRNDE